MDPSNSDEDIALAALTTSGMREGASMYSQPAWPFDRLDETMDFDIGATVMGGRLLDNYESDI